MRASRILVAAVFAAGLGASAAFADHTPACDAFDSDPNTPGNQNSCDCNGVEDTVGGIVADPTGAGDGNCIADSDSNGSACAGGNAMTAHGCIALQDHGSGILAICGDGAGIGPCADAADCAADAEAGCAE